MDKTVLFWILFGVLGFAFALAVQMRIVTALVLRRALGAWREGFADRAKANRAVILAAGATPLTGDLETEMTEAVTHLRETYASALGHLRTARRYSIVAPVLLLALVAIGRTILGVI
ncbi:MAG: hypothetical protein VX599_03790 [Pseudomonadota bacterium]|nr:hypothetical protein [Pseudomonadota bacterium]